MVGEVKQSPYKTIHIMAKTYDKLLAMKHKGQSFDGLPLSKRRTKENGNSQRHHHNIALYFSITQLALD